MKVVNDFLGEVEYTDEDIIVFEDGILGFSSTQKYILVTNPDPVFPFNWLQSVDESDVSFILTNPFLFVSEYDFEIPDSVIEKLDIEDIEDVAIYSMVVIPEEPKQTTINLKSPLIINNRTKHAKQVILEEDFALKYEIFQKEES